MSVQARFYVHSVLRLASSVRPQGWAEPVPWITVTLVPATRGGENKEWASSTPSGKIEMTVGNPVASKWFEDRLGRDIAITFDDRPEEETAQSSSPS